MNSIGPHGKVVLDAVAVQALEHAMALTMGLLRPRSVFEAMTEPLPVAETREMDWSEWCAATVELGPTNAG